MPPAPAWFSGPAEIGAFLRTGPNGGRLGEIRLVATRANRQPALAAYLPGPHGSHLAYGVMVFDVVRGRICAFTGFSDARLVALFGLPEALRPDWR